VAAAETAPAAGTEAEPAAAPAEAPGPGETEVFWTYRWAPRRPVRPVRPVRPAPAEGDREARPRHSRSAGKPKGKPRGDRVKEDRPERTERPPRAEKPVDPDNPFAALLALKLGKE
jgi:ATP-dependent RNA helicase SUPV3L1/SUV3